MLVASAVHRMGVPGYTTYSASKAAIRSFARTWAAEFRTRGIRVNVISPCLVDTPAIDRQAAGAGAGAGAGDAEAVRAQMAAERPLGRLGSPEEIASATPFLASAEAGCTARADLVVDWGQSQLWRFGASRRTAAGDGAPTLPA